MIAECGKCQIRHRLELSAVKGRKAKFRCKRCGHVTTVATSEYVRSTIMGKGSQENALESLNETSSESENSAPPETAIPIVQPTISGMSIRTKITLVIVTLIVFSLSTVGFIASNRGSKALSKQAVDHLGLISDQKAKEYNNIFSRLQNEIESVALYASGTFARNDIRQNLDFRLLMPWNGTSYGGAGIATAHMSEVLALQRVGVSLRGLVKKNPYLELGYMATENNIMVLDNEDVVGIIEAEKSYIPTRRPWYIDAVKSKGTVWTQPYIDVNTKKLVVTCATPVNRLDNSIVGVVGFDVLLDTIQ